jgi:hypothetical protein
LETVLTFVVIVVIAIGGVGGFILIPEILNVARRIFGKSTTVTGSITDRHEDRDGNRPPDDHIAFTTAEEPTGSWLAIDGTHLLVTQRALGKYKIGDIVTAKIAGNRATSISTGVDPNSKSIEIYEAELTAEAEARNWDLKEGEREWNKKVSIIASIIAAKNDRVVQVDGLTDKIHINDEFVGDLSSKDHDLC